MLSDIIVNQRFYEMMLSGSTNLDSRLTRQIVFYSSEGNDSRNPVSLEFRPEMQEGNIGFENFARNTCLDMCSLDGHQLL